MTAKEIMRLSPDARLALEARARVGDDMESFVDCVLLMAWKAVENDKSVPAEKKEAAYEKLLEDVIPAIKRGFEREIQRNDSGRNN